MLERSLSGYGGMHMKEMVHQHLGPVSSGGSSSPDPSYLDTSESARNYKITARLNAKNFMGNIVTRVELPNDKGDDNQIARNKEWFRQAAMPWGYTWMTTPNQAQRMNNNAQASFVKQRQLSIPNTYGQFYAFMHALSAAFGNLGTGK
jgi:hypothetical protein